MSKCSRADALNMVIARSAPAAALCLSPRGKQLVFPEGIPHQAAQAKHCSLNATYGQFTDRSGNPGAPSAVMDGMSGVEPKAAFLYSPVAGAPGLRKAWSKRQRAGNGGSKASISLPVVTHGLAHGLSLTAGLFVDEKTTVLMPDPGWGNYSLIFGGRGATHKYYSVFKEGEFYADGLRDALGDVSGKVLVVLNVPGNPTGYSPTPSAISRWLRCLYDYSGPMVAVVDDAYLGWVYDSEAETRSIYWQLAEMADPEKLFVVKVDGATKELVFFGSRIGFLSHSGAGDSVEALESKLKCHIRATVGCVSGPAAVLVEKALASPALEQDLEDVRQEMRARYTCLKGALSCLEPTGVVVWPFNAGFFALLGLPAHIPVASVHSKLLERSVGVIMLPDHNAIRIAYCSLKASDIQPLVDNIYDVLSAF